MSESQGKKTHPELHVGQFVLCLVAGKDFCDFNGTNTLKPLEIWLETVKMQI